MRYQWQLILASLAFAGWPAAAQPAVDGKLDAEDAKQKLVARVVELPDINGELRMPAWRAEVLEKMRAVWKRPSESANSATWIIRAKVDSSGRLLNLSWVSPTGDRTLDRSIVKAFKRAEPFPAPPNTNAAIEGLEFADETTSIGKAEEQKARNLATVERIKKAGPLHAYLALVTHRYKKCEAIANEFLESTVTTGAGMILVEDCTREAEPALADDVRLALLIAPAKVSDQVKDLYAYAVASLRALSNFNQSIVEARQVRAARSAGIDERTTRISLDLQGWPEQASETACLKTRSHVVGVEN